MIWQYVKIVMIWRKPQVEDMTDTVDLNTGKIHATKGTRTYYHEIGHIKFNSTHSGASINYNTYFYMWISVLFLSVNAILPSYPLKYGAFGFMTMAFLFYIYQETWCWVFAFKRYNETENKTKTKKHPD